MIDLPSPVLFLRSAGQKKSGRFRDRSSVICCSGNPEHGLETNAQHCTTNELVLGANVSAFFAECPGVSDEWAEGGGFRERPVKGELDGEVGKFALLNEVSEGAAAVKGKAGAQLDALAEVTGEVAVVVAFDVPVVGQRGVKAEEFTGQGEVGFLSVLKDGATSQRKEVVIGGASGVVVVDVTHSSGGKAKILRSFDIDVEFVGIGVVDVDRSTSDASWSLEGAIPCTGAEAKAVPLGGNINSSFDKVLTEVQTAEKVFAGVASVDFVFDFSRGVASREGGGSGQGANCFAVVLHSVVVVFGCW